MKLVQLFIIIIFLSACSSTPKRYENDLIGVWGNSDDGGKTFWGYNEYLVNGVTRAWGTFQKSEESYELEGVYKIEYSSSPKSCITVTKSSIPDILPIGHYFCSEIVELNQTHFKFIFHSVISYSERLARF
mgnify:CR=1 FL=1